MWSLPCLASCWHELMIEASGSCCAGPPSHRVGPRPCTPPPRKATVQWWSCCWPRAPLSTRRCRCSVCGCPLLVHTNTTEPFFHATSDLWSGSSLGFGGAGSTPCMMGASSLCLSGEGQHVLSWGWRGPACCHVPSSCTLLSCS